MFTEVEFRQTTIRTFPYQRAMSIADESLDQIYWRAKQMESTQAREAFLDQLAEAAPDRAAMVRDLLVHEQQAADLFGKLSTARPFEATRDSVPVHGRDSDLVHQSDAALLSAGDSIGPYKLLEPIGEGGMGVVYLAQQSEPVRRKVALKIIKPGMDSRQVVARFEAERQALAMMEHPNIARALDAGTTESGLPYFVMELVRGIPMSEYCDRAKMTNDNRLKLFCDACGAIQHAHNKGIIHRDIKPSNVLVTENDGTPVVKVIDFGVAKALTDNLTDKTLFTGMFQMIGTPLYMSPEQASLSNLDVDVRSDVYSLGVMLYELVSGTLPVDRETAKELNFEQLRQRICDTEPPRPSKRLSTLKDERETIAEHRGVDLKNFHRLVTSELDWIVMKAIEKDRKRRYQSARELGEDVQRYLDGDAVEARATTFSYRLKVFVRQNRTLVTSATAVLLALHLGVFLAVWQAYQASQQTLRAIAAELDSKNKQMEAVKQAERAEKNLRLAMAAVNEMYVEASDRVLSLTPASQTYRKRILERALKFYMLFLEQNSGLKLNFEIALTWRRVGEIYHRFGDNEKAIEALQNSAEILEALTDRETPQRQIQGELAATYRFLAKPYEVMQRNREAEKYCRVAIEIGLRIVRRFPHAVLAQDEVAKSYHQLGHVLNEPSDAGQAFQSAIDVTQQLLDRKPADPAYSRQLAHNLSHMGKIHFEATKLAEAESAYRTAINLLNGAENHPHADVLDSFQAISSGLFRNLGVLLRETDRIEEAEMMHRASVEKARVLAESFPSVMYYQSQLAKSRDEYAITLEMADDQKQQKASNDQ